MTRTIDININGQVFHIEESAYDILNDYIEELTEHPKYMRSDDSDSDTEEVIKPEDNKKVLIFKNRQR